MLYRARTFPGEKSQSKEVGLKLDLLLCTNKQTALILAKLTYDIWKAASLRNNVLV